MIKTVSVSPVIKVEFELVPEVKLERAEKTPNTINIERYIDI